MAALFQLATTPSSENSSNTTKMAFKKTITLPNGVEVEYFRIDQIALWDRLERTASFRVAAYKNQSTAARGGDPVRGCVAKIRLSGADFDLIGADKVAGAYVAAKNGKGVISDFGADVFKDAEDV